MEHDTHLAYLGTGSNLGERSANLERAIELIGQQVGRVLKVSSVYQTEAWGITDQPEFLNQALLVETILQPEQVLDAILSIERQMGRIRDRKWAERLIDIDLLFYDDQILVRPRLIVPHPFIAARNFVLAPLCEIAPEFRHPVLGLTIKSLLQISPDPLRATPFKTA